MSSGGSSSSSGGGAYNEVQAAALQVNDSVAAIMQNVPVGLHKFLTAKPKNMTRGECFVCVLLIIMELIVL